jgi:hypothetical protein
MKFWVVQKFEDKELMRTNQDDTELDATKRALALANYRLSVSGLRTYEVEIEK